MKKGRRKREREREREAFTSMNNYYIYFLKLCYSYIANIAFI